MDYFKPGVLRLLLLTFFSASVLTVNAGGILEVKPFEEGGKAKAMISFANLEAKNVVLSIEDLDRKVVYYQENLKNASDFAKVFDLALLNDGTYVINVKAGNEVLTETFQIADSELTVKDTGTTIKPIFRLKDNILFVYFHRGGSGFYSISFFDNTGEFFSDDLGSTTGIKKYSLENIPEGEYIVSVSGAKESFYFDFIKD